MATSNVDAVNEDIVAEENAAYATALERKEEDADDETKGAPESDDGDGTQEPSGDDGSDAKPNEDNADDKRDKESNDQHKVEFASTPFEEDVKINEAQFGAFFQDGKEEAID